MHVDGIGGVVEDARLRVDDGGVAAVGPREDVAAVREVAAVHRDGTRVAGGSDDLYDRADNPDVWTDRS